MTHALLASMLCHYAALSNALTKELPLALPERHIVAAVPSWTVSQLGALIPSECLSKRPAH
jgi:hypothetical protein